MRGGTEFVIVLVVLMMISVTTTTTFAANVSYDHRALVIDGKRRVLISGSIHYPRSTPEMWPDLIQKSKDGGLDVIETYVFWNLHEPVQNQYDFEGRKDLVKFVKLVAEAGLYLHLRIGPYVCAEWNYGGFPLWLHFIPGIELRTDNEPFKAEMKRFTAKIVDLMKQEKLYASQGGPIILSQIENEYGNIDSAYGPAAKTYIRWAASMANSLDTGVPWVMCQQADAPDPMINTCNGFYCDQFTPNSNKKPKMWTENWSGWFLPFGGAVPYRPVEDLAFSVARFYQRGGTFQNYYMYHGGTNFERTTGGPFIATTYDYDAPIDEYGLLRQPKWGHLKDLHKAVKLCEEAMVATDPTITSPGPNLEVSVYKTGSGLCSAFLANVGTQSDATVNFGGSSYNLPAWSVSILPDCKSVAFNTAKINSMATIPRFISQSLKDDVSSSEAFKSDWSWVSEPVGISNNNAFTKPGLLEQINTTADNSDYMWYSLSTEIKGDEPFLHDGSQTVLHVDSLGHVLHAFVNGKLAGSEKGNSGNAKVSLNAPITLVPGTNKFDLLSLTVGLQNYGAFFDKTGAGITGPVQLKGLKNGTTVDLSSKQWTYQVGLKGEGLRLYTGDSSVWMSKPTFPTKQPLIWYKYTEFQRRLQVWDIENRKWDLRYLEDQSSDTYTEKAKLLIQTNFDAPAGDSPVAIDFTGMGKGEAWINGQSIGRYWPTYASSNSGCTNSCNYRGSYSSNKCLKNCGKPSQVLYHVPRSWLKSSGNTIVLFEEMGGDPTQISFATREITSLCSHVSESHPLPVEMWTSDQKTGTKHGGALVSLECPLPNQACIGSKSCSIGVSRDTFGDLCVGVTKSLAVEASCT
ncbi:hypothetical protein LguiB_000969 [Lonicera macranthoides]